MIKQVKTHIVALSEKVNQGKLDSLDNLYIAYQQQYALEKQLIWKSFQQHQVRAPFSYLGSTKDKPGAQHLTLSQGYYQSLLRTCYSDGDLLGQGFLTKLSRYDKKITHLASGRQRSGLKVRCQRYDHYVNQIRSFIKNEVNRVLNHLIKLKKPTVVVMEKLNFRYANLSKRLNRILRNFGKSLIEVKLAELAKLHSFRIEKVNPAYTSQECSGCGYIDEKNRKSQACFECLWCNRKAHADCNGAKVIRQRLSIVVDSGDYKPRKQLLQDRLSVFLKRAVMNCRLSTARETVLKANPHLKSFLDENGELALNQLT